MTYRFQEIATQKELIVHYDRLKLFHEPSLTPNVPTRDRRNRKNIPPLSPRQHEQVLPEFDHDQCTWHCPYHTVLSATTSSSRVACTTPTVMPASATTSIGSLKSVLPSPSFSNSGATAPYSHGSPGTPKTTIFFRSSTPTPEPLTSSAKSPVNSRSLPSSRSTPFSVRSKARFREVIDNASRTLQSVDAPTQAQPQRNLRNSTTQKCKAKPLWKAIIPPDLSEFNSPPIPRTKRKTSSPCNLPFLSERYLKNVYPLSLFQDLPPTPERPA